MRETGGPKGPARPRSGWVPEDARHTVTVKIRCKAMLADRARLLARQRGITLADVLAAGVAALEA